MRFNPSSGHWEKTDEDYAEEKRRWDEGTERIYRNRWVTMTTISATHDTYTISFANGRKAETIEGSYGEALDYVRELAGPDVEVGHDGDLSDGGDRTLFWASEEDSIDDDGARALGSIRSEARDSRDGAYAGHTIRTNTTMTTIDATLSALGLSVIWTTGSEGETVSSVAIPRDDARRAVAALRSIGAEASEAPDNDDRNVSWLYVSARRPDR